MSTRGRGRGRGKVKVTEEVSDESPQEDIDVSLSAMQLESAAKKVPKPRAKNLAKDPDAILKQMDILLRNQDIARSKLEVIIDTLEGDDDAGRRNVSLAVKHIKDVIKLLEH